MKHTPGPWTVIGRELHGPDDSGVIVARIPEWGKLADTADPGPNNARLIAAAPDLLAALRALLRDCERLGFEGRNTARIKQQARAALARLKA
jgi:hypothetical protein